MHDPAVLVRDEPFSGLDPVAAEVMSGVLREKAAAGVPVLFSSHQLDLVERAVRPGRHHPGRPHGGLRHGELRATGAEQVVVDVPGAPPGWTSVVPGNRVLETTGSRVLLELEPGVDDQAVLVAALCVGAVREFGRYRPPLTALYRHVVTSSDRPDRVAAPALVDAGRDR